MVRPVEARDDLDQGGLAAAVFSCQAQCLSFQNLKVHILQRVNTTERDRDLVQLNESFPCHAVRPFQLELLCICKEMGTVMISSITAPRKAN